MKRKRILIIDDHQLFSAGLSSLLSGMAQSVEVLEVDNANTALTMLERGDKFDLVLVDINMPSLNGFDMLAAVSSRKLNSRIAMISENSDLGIIQKAIDKGAAGYIPKICSPNVTLDGISTLLLGKSFVPPHLSQYIHFGISINNKDRGEEESKIGKTTVVLNQRQLQVISLLKNGKSNKEIANILAISQSTVKFHIAALFRKLEVNTRTECVVAAVRKKLITA